MEQGEENDDDIARDDATAEYHAMLAISRLHPEALQEVDFAVLRDNGHQRVDLYLEGDYEGVPDARLHSAPMQELEEFNSKYAHYEWAWEVLKSKCDFLKDALGVFSIRVRKNHLRVDAEKGFVYLKFYSLFNFCVRCLVSYNVAERWVTMLQKGSKRQMILCGPSGCGKSFAASHLLAHVLHKQQASSNDTIKTRKQKVRRQIAEVVFHPSFSYQQFIFGARVFTVPGEKGEEGVVLAKPGVLMAHLDKFRNKEPCGMVIDELNRANTAAVFGEALKLLEYRGHFETLDVNAVSEAGAEPAGKKPRGQDEPHDVSAVSEAGAQPAAKKFCIQKNFWLIGTMNDRDRSIDALDRALRERFWFVKLKPKEGFHEYLERWLFLKTIFPDKESKDSVSLFVSALRAANTLLKEAGQSARIGHARFLHGRNKQEFEANWGFVVDHSIKPLLKEELPGEHLKELRRKVIKELRSPLAAAQKK